jgi:kynurenine formamidase
MRVGRVVDLSLALDAGTQVYPGDPEVRLTPAATLAVDGFNLLAVAMGSQSGTNCDAPYHFLESGARIDEVPLPLFVGPGVLLDVRGKPPRSPITEADVAPWLDALAPGTIAVLHTGWSAHYGEPAYFDHPYLSAEACQALLDRGVRTICLDTLNIDETPDDQHPGAGFPCHLLVAQVGGIVVDNLTNLAAVDFPDPLLSVLPLRLTGADGGPTRAVAIEITP